MGVDYFANIDKPAIEVWHHDLQRTGDEDDPFLSAYRSWCPVCGLGILMVYRNDVTMALRNVDCCTRCCQKFIYNDTEINGEPVEPWSMPVPNPAQDARQR